MNAWKVCIFLLGVAASALCQETINQSEEEEAFFRNAARAESFIKEDDFAGAISSHQRFFDDVYPHLSPGSATAASEQAPIEKTGGEKKSSHYIAISHLRIAAIYQDYLSNYEKAMENYKRVLSVTGKDRLTYLSKEAARRWLERIRLNLLREALSRYYASEVEYPVSLKKLSMNGFIDKDYLIDSCGNSYIYRSEPSKLFQKLKRQEYTLYCRTLEKEAKKLSTLINERKTFRVQFALEGLLESAGTKVAVIRYKQWEKGTGCFFKPVTKMLREGEKIGRAQILEIRGTGVILCAEDDIIVLTTRR